MNEAPQIPAGVDTGRPTPMADSDGSRWLYCGVARKP